jgi:lysyl-tRNA synthetase class 2
MADESIPDWRPTASWRSLRRRASLLAQIRAFFALRGVMEVETPLLAAASVTDPYLKSLHCPQAAAGGEAGAFLQTSPEFAMKRLLAAGSGPIYQICKAFRAGERGSLHNPEFTMLEWYRPTFDHHALMDEVEALLVETLGTESAQRVTYAALFDQYLGIDPHAATAAGLTLVAVEQDLEVVGFEAAGRDDWLDLLMNHVIEPTLGRGRPTFVLDYPASQAALARLRPGTPPVAERFEVYVEGVELVNGFRELTDVSEQRRRFVADNHRRQALGLPRMAPDRRFLAALEHGLPPCSGVALGIDRLAMLATGSANIEQVITWPSELA